MARLDYILTPHVEYRLIRRITVYPVLRAESDHSIVATTTRLHRRLDPNLLKRPANRHPWTDRQNVVNNDDNRGDVIRAIDSELRKSAVSSTGKVDCVVSVLTDMVLRTATRILPPPPTTSRKGCVVNGHSTQASNN